MIDKEKLLLEIDKEIEFAKGTGMPVFVMGLLQARKVIEDYFYREDKPFRAEE